MPHIGPRPYLLVFLAEMAGVPGCWIYPTKHDRLGYGSACIAGRKGLAHRMAYELLVGPIPAGMDIDHLCRNAGCVNPQHLEPVTHLTNVRRGAKVSDRCPNGHVYADVGHYNKGGARSCKECAAERQRRYRARLHGAP